MTHELPAPKHHIAGDSLIQRITVLDGDDGDGDESKDLANAEVRYELLRPNGDAILDSDESDDPISVVVEDEANGLIEVEFEAGATDDVVGEYRARLTIEDQHGRVNTFGGYLDVLTAWEAAEIEDEDEDD